MLLADAGMSDEQLMYAMEEALRDAEAERALGDAAKMTAMGEREEARERG